MNEKLNDFLGNMGVLCEVWNVTYNNFKNQGMDHKNAMEHTKGFMAAFMDYISKSNGGK